MANGTTTTLATPGGTPHNALQIATTTKTRYDFNLHQFYKKIIITNKQKKKAVQLSKIFAPYNPITVIHIKCSKNIKHGLNYMH